MMLLKYKPLDQSDAFRPRVSPKAWAQLLDMGLLGLCQHNKCCFLLICLRDSYLGSFPTISKYLTSMQRIDFTNPTITPVWHKHKPIVNITNTTTWKHIKLGTQKEVSLISCLFRNQPCCTILCHQLSFPFRTQHIAFQSKEITRFCMLYSQSINYRSFRRLQNTKYKASGLSPGQF
jgi:hypothetical protein